MALRSCCSCEVFLLLICLTIVSRNGDAYRLRRSPTVPAVSRLLGLSKPVAAPPTSVTSLHGTKVLLSESSTQSEIPHLPSWKKNLPNALTMFRMATIPTIIIAFVLKLRATVFALYVLSCISDFLDGYLARRWKVTSAFGKLWDPVADKLAVTTVLILLCVQFPTLAYVVPVLVILLREITISALREQMAGQDTHIPVSILGKIKTTLQMLASMCLVTVYTQTKDMDLCAWMRIPKEAMFIVGLGGLYVACALTVWSGWEYVRGVARRRDGKRIN